MKKLSFFLFAILILACGTEKPVVEEPEPVIEQLEPIIEEPPSVVEDPTAGVWEDEPVIPEIPSLRIIEGSVFDKEVDVDPEPLNQDGFIFNYADALWMYTAEIQDNRGATLSWDPLDVVVVINWVHPNRVQIAPIAASQLLEYDSEYVIKIYAQIHGCNGAETVIRFRTKSR